MTFKEKMLLDHPNVSGSSLFDRKCPSDYGYEKTNGDQDECQNAEMLSCKECWNREIPENTETVNHPAHYQGKHECIDEMIALFGRDAVIGFCKCNVHKYRYRADQKGKDEDMKKANWYMDKLLELEGNHDC